jgi:peptidylprolyl isomerase
VGTAKRERQKANRQLRLQELAKQARKEKTKRTSLRVGLGIVAVFAIAGAVYLFSGGDDKSTTAATSTTLDPLLDTTTTAPASPCVTPSVDTTPTDSTVAPAVPAKPTPTPLAAAPTALKVTTITEGTGEGAKVCDELAVHYLGYTSTDGTVFDNSSDRGSPITLQLGVGQVIAGWDQGLVGLKVGGRYQIDIPSDLAYGDAPTGGQPAGALTFIVDVMSITPGEATPSTTDTTVTADSTVGSGSTPATDAVTTTS